jgi:F0F1-type ATP synthase membrane subunit b/b'
VLSAAEEKARKRTEQILSDAHDEISKDVIAAKKVLHDETLSLVGLATERVLRKVVTKDIDQKLIKESLEEVA